MQHAMDTEDELEGSLQPAEEGGTELEAEAKEGELEEGNMELEEGNMELEEGELVEKGELAGAAELEAEKGELEGPVQPQWTQRTSWRGQCSACNQRLAR